MDIRSSRFILIVVLTALIVGLADLVETTLTTAGYSGMVRPGYPHLVIIDLRTLATGATLAGLTIVTAVLTTAALDRPGWWCRLPAMLIGLTVVTVVAASDEIFNYSAAFVDGTPDFNPLPLVAIWLPGAALAVARERGTTTPAPVNEPATIRSRTIKVLIALGIAVLLLVVAGTSSGGFLRDGIYDPLTEPYAIRFATITLAVVAAWRTATCPRAVAGWLLIAGLLASGALVVDFGVAYTLVMAVAVASILVARIHPRLVAQTRHRVAV